MRVKPGKGDRRELHTGKSVKQVTAKPKGAKPEAREPKRPPENKSILGQSGSRKKGSR
jgi:hypothetical protein